jgi:voltage-gated potassium channel
VPVFRVIHRHEGQLMLHRWKHALWRSLGLLSLTLLVCVAGLILLDPQDHSWPLKTFDALWNAVNAVTTIGDFTGFNRAQRGFMLATLFLFVVVGGYAITTLTGVLSSEEVQVYRENRTMTRLLDQLRDHAVVVGFGPVGRLVAEALKARGLAVVVVDLDPAATGEASGLGYLVVEGDASVDEETLNRARIETARVAYITTEDPDRKLTITLMARTANPALAICVTGQNDARGALLKRAGATEVVVIDTLIAQSLVARSDATAKVSRG